MLKHISATNLLTRKGVNLLPYYLFTKKVAETVNNYKKLLICIRNSKQKKTSKPSAWFPKKKPLLCNFIF